MDNILENIISSEGWILADGATGTNLFNMGLQSGDAPELWNLEFPEKIKKLYRDSIVAGCDLFLTNSFGGNSSRLALHNAANRAAELSSTGVLHPFKVSFQIQLKNAEYYELKIHKILDSYRVKNNREFFEIDLNKIKNCLKQVSEISEKGSKKITLIELKKEINL